MPVKMTDWQRADRRRIRHPDVYGGPFAPVLVLGTHNVMRHTPANGAEVEIDIPAVATPIRPCLPGRMNVMAIVPVCPQATVAPADSAVARRDGLWHRIECPPNSAAMACSFQHVPASVPVLLAIRAMGAMAAPLHPPRYGFQSNNPDCTSSSRWQHLVLGAYDGH